MRPEFWVWAPDDSFEDEATLMLDCCDPEMAAKEFVEAQHGDFDYATEVEVCVKDKDGNVTRWTVTAEEVVIFHASQNQEKK